ncbi:hypothetical protein HDV00_004702 [Rhizophlyctis rosea]|nr:hypothetical protein HDV00_004702 [Rhizophlyctis rosea]
MSYQTTIQHLPLETLVRVAQYVRRLDRYDDHHNRLAQVDKGFRIASFLVHPGDTLSRFQTEVTLCRGLSDPMRVLYLRSLFLMIGITPSTLHLVLTLIDLSTLRILALDDPGDLLPTIAADFSNLERPLGFESFTLHTRGVEDPNSWQFLQQIVNSLAGAPIKQLVLKTESNNAQHHHLRFNKTLDLLVSISISSVFVLDDLTTATPNLVTLTIDHGRRIATDLYPMHHILLPNLSIQWVGDCWAESISSLPLATRNTLHSLDIRSFANHISDTIPTLLPYIPNLKIIRLRPWTFDANKTDDFPTLATLKSILTQCTSLTRVDIPLLYYDADELIQEIRSCSSLESVSFVLGNSKDEYELARVRRETHKLVSLRGVWNVFSEIKDWAWLEEDTEEQGED